MMLSEHFSLSELTKSETVMENCEFDQLILEFYKEDIPHSGWVHCSYTIENDNRKSARVFDGRHWTALA